ncbi:hypothetical protein TNCT_376731 [Trichonephila clavata]|uniref:Uncharacterized protein n=1 Tax=Trichonephila clavata TaxID=2740835 RepID=A0A8X6F904_TRICU|nr:hypothetical protein TNCT_224551 [Trichonephila clavata]GFR02072.1 hypothetical protein TNCT_376731 [Trichonephila clavata]
MEVLEAAEELFGNELGEPRLQRPPRLHLPRAVSVAALRMRTGHHYLAAPFTASMSYHHQSASFVATVL